MSPVAFTIRPALIDDEEAVFELASQLATSFAVDRAAFTPVFRSVLSDNNCYIHVASLDSQMIGYLLGCSHPAFFANGPVAWVQEILVIQERRRLGVGKALMEHFEAWAKSRGRKLVSLATRRAGDFYKSIGYGESAIYYKKDL